MIEVPIYPKIPFYGKNTPFKQCIAYKKYDGTNLALHWNAEHGFQGIFTRRPRKIENDDPDFESAISIFKELEPELEKAFSLFPDASDIVVYSEYFGLRSAFGNHHPDDFMQVILLDAWVSSQGFLKPEDFAKKFSAFLLPKVVYRGKITGKFVENVKNNKLPYLLNEGVVCKGQDGSWMCKIKTQSWLSKLENSFSQRLPFGKTKSWLADDGIIRQLDDEISN